MNKRSNIMALLLIGLCATLSAQQSMESALSRVFQGKQHLVIAVMTFVNDNGKHSVLGRYFAEESINYLLKRPELRLVDRSYLYELEKEWDFSSSGLVSDMYVVEIGKMLGADALVVGSLTPLGRQRIAVNMRIIDARTGEILSAGRTELSGSQYTRMYNQIIE